MQVRFTRPTLLFLGGNGVAILFKGLLRYVIALLDSMEMSSLKVYGCFSAKALLLKVLCF